MPGAHGADGALRAELGERGHGLADRLIQVVLRVVDVDELDPVEAEPVEALVDRTADALAAVIADAPESGGLREDVGAGRFAGCAGDEQPADLRAEDVLVPGTVAQCRPEPLLGQPGAVVRSRVERAHAEIPGRVDGRARLLLGHGREQPTQRRAAHHEPADPHVGRAEGHLLHPRRRPQPSLLERAFPIPGQWLKRGCGWFGTTRW